MNDQLNGFVPRRAGSARESEIRVFLAYEDRVAGLQAMQILDAVLTSGQAPLLAGFSIWKFELLAMPEFRKAALADAVLADLIVVSKRGDGALPDGVAGWLQDWIANRGERPVALIGLLCDVPADTTGVSPTEAQLEDLADRGGTNIFVRRPGRWALLNDSEGDAESGGGLRPSFIPESGGRWGLNE